MSFRIGDTVGEYKIAGVLGSGGMGQVFRVEHSLTNRVEAMKVLVAHPMEGAEPASRFLREVKIHASLNHPNIVTVHNAFQVGDDLALVMELVEGRSLKDLIQQGRVPLADGVRIIVDVLAGLSYAHQRGIIHRDISPSNIIVTDSGEAKLMDFGLSKQVAEPSAIQSGVVLGTVYYCSPEQVKGSTNLDARSDIYSLGVVLYQAITGLRPFNSDTPFNIMMDHVDSAPTPPADMDRAIPRALNDIILKAMAKQPRDRFQTADEFRQALNEVWVGLGAGAGARRMPSIPRWRVLAEGCIRLSGRRSVQIGLLAAGLAFPATVVVVNTVSYSAPAFDLPTPFIVAPSVPLDALEVAKSEPDTATVSADSPTLPATVEEAPVKPRPEPLAKRSVPSQGVMAKPATERVTHESATVALPATDLHRPATAPAPARDRETPKTIAAVPPASPAASQPMTAADSATEPPTVADSSAGPVTNAEPQSKNGIRKLLGKVFHRKKKASAPVATFAEPAGHESDGR